MNPVPMTIHQSWQRNRQRQCSNQQPLHTINQGTQACPFRVKYFFFLKWKFSEIICCLPNNRISDSLNLKPFSDFAQTMKFVFETVENIAEKGGNDGYQHILILCNFSKCSPVMDV